MIFELTKENLNKIANSFISMDFIKDELNNNPFAKILILEENSEIIGYLYYSDIYERAEINQFEINSFHRNCGKGNKLLQKMIKTVEKDITLEVKSDNYPAIALYKKNGFISKAIRKNYYKDTDGILMERKKDI